MSETPVMGIEWKPECKAQSGSSISSLIALSKCASPYKRNVRYNLTQAKQSVRVEPTRADLDQELVGMDANSYVAGCDEVGPSQPLQSRQELTAIKFNVPHQWIPFVSADHVIPFVTQGGARFASANLAYPSWTAPLSDESSIFKSLSMHRLTASRRRLRGSQHRRLRLAVKRFAHMNLHMLSRLKVALSN